MIDSIFKFMASLRLAVFVIVSLGVVAATGTIIEAKYNDADVAQQLVYKSPYMYAVLGLLCVNLIAVMIDRWPWKIRHAPFIFAHIGIIMTLIGALVTQKMGVDGNLIFEPGQSQRFVSVKNRDLVVYASMNGNDVRPIYQHEVDFLRDSPKDRPLVIPVGSDTLEVTDYYHYAIRESEIVPSSRPMDGPAIRFELENAKVNLTQWLQRDDKKPYSSINLGPAKVVLSDGSYKPESATNEIVVWHGPSANEVRYAIYSQGLLSKRGIMKESEALDTGWMGLKFHVLRYYPKAREKVTYISEPYSTEQTQSAIQLKIHGETYWLGLNSILRVYGDDRMYIISFGQRRIPLDFALTLKQFHVGRYQGTARAASYESDVDVPGQGEVKISMNEPLKYGGFTFYQASFEQDESGKPTASVLSVNYDPGRYIKYIGSLLIVFGASMLFWFRKVFYNIGKSSAQKE